MWAGLELAIHAGKEFSSHVNTARIYYQVMLA